MVIFGLEFREIKEFKSYAKSIFKRLSDVFNYDALINRKNISEKICDIKLSEWSGYQIAYHLGARVCVYCNRNYTITMKINNSGLVRPQLDHFYPKSKYPYLAISLYNLVPSCSTCNATLKRDVAMLDSNYTDLYIHPYEKEFDQNVKFNFHMDSAYKVRKYYTKIESNQLKVVLEGVTVGSPEYNSIELFKLDELYKLHKDEFTDIINLVNSYSSSSFEEINKIIPQGSTIKQNRKRELINFLKPNSAKDRTLGKATTDLLTSLDLDF